MSGMIADHRRNLGRVGKIETLPIFPICLRPSQTDFQFSLVGKVWDGRETVESPIVWDFPDIWKLGFKASNINATGQRQMALPIFTLRIYTISKPLTRSYE